MGEKYMKNTSAIYMKKLLFIGLTMTLGINGYASECISMLKPSDFQLDKNFVAQNESIVFSKIGNRMVHAKFFGYVAATYCDRIQANPNEKTTQVCTDELMKLSEEYTSKYDSQGIKELENVSYSQMQSYGLKTSPNTPISQEHLCYLGDKYKGVMTLESFKLMHQRLSSMRQRIEDYKQQLNYNYAIIATQIGTSKDANMIMNTFLYKLR